MLATKGCEMPEAMRASSRNIRWKRHVFGVLREDELHGEQLLEAVLAVQPREPHGGHAALRQRTKELVTIELIARIQSRRRFP